MASRETIDEVKKAIADLRGHQKDQPLNLQEMAANPVDCAKVQMGLAFAVNSLFYSMMRVQGKAKQLGDGHPVMGQIERVKLRYIKLRQAEQEKERAEKAESRSRIDKEATERIVKNALGSQLREDDQKRNQQKNLMSDSDSETESKPSSAVAAKAKHVKKLPQSKPISKKQTFTSLQPAAGKASRKDMHGATVVPLAAHLKYKKLLEK